MSFLVVDLGTSNCKVSIVSAEGVVLSSSRREVSVNIQGEFAEIDTDSAWEIVSDVIREEVKKHDCLDIEAVGISAMLGYVALNKNCEPITPAMVWMDNRATVEVETVKESINVEDLYKITGRRISPELLLPKILWFKKHKPSLLKSVWKFIGLKDEIVKRLTGTVQTDYAHANYSSLFNVYKRKFENDLFPLFGITTNIMPEPRLATDVVGTLKRDVALKLGLIPGVPVISGSSDGTTAMYGGGVISEGIGVLVSGTTDVLMILSKEPVVDSECVLSINNGMINGTWLVGGATGVSGGTLKKLEKIFSRSIDEVEVLIKAIEPGSEKLLFSPGLSGERAPYWMEQHRGTITGFSFSHEIPHFYKAIMEGSAYRLLHLLEIMKKNNLLPIKINIVGGGAKRNIWNQIRADVLGMEICKLRNIEATSLGLALFCAAGLEGNSSLSGIVNEWIVQERSFLPDIDAHKRYSLLAKIFREYMVNTETIVNKLARI